MAEKRPTGWVIAVRAPNALISKLYAVVAGDLEDAKALVGDHLKVTNEKVDFERVLSDSELTRLGLKLGEVKDYA